MNIISYFNFPYLPDGNMDSHTLRSREKNLRVVYVLSHSGGGGHRAAADAVKRALGDTFQVVIDEPMDDFAADNLFNYFQKRGSAKALRLLSNMQYLAEYTVGPVKMRGHIVSRIKELDPVMLISVFPIANFITLDLAKEYNIPFLVMTTDFYSQHFFHHIEDPGPSFKITLPFDDAQLKEPLRHQFSDENFAVTGYAIRPEFCLPPQALEGKVADIKKAFHIADQDRVAMIMMGAQGAGDTIVRYAQIVAQSSTDYPYPVHFFALCGSNEELLKNCQQVAANSQNPQVKVHPLGRQDACFVASLMQMSFVLITKPGGSTLNEALAKEIFMLIHNDGEATLRWESYNKEFVVDKGWAEEIDEQKFLAQFDACMERPPIMISNCPGREFTRNFRQVVFTMLEEKTRFNNQTLSVSALIQDRFEDNRLVNYFSERAKQEAMVNIQSNPSRIMATVLAPKLKKAVDTKNADELFQFSEKDLHTIVDLAFTWQNKGLLRRIENAFVRYFLKNHLRSVLPSLVKQVVQNCVPQPVLEASVALANGEKIPEKAYVSAMETTFNSLGRIASHLFLTPNEKKKSCVQQLPMQQKTFPSTLQRIGEQILRSNLRRSLHLFSQD